MAEYMNDGQSIKIVVADSSNKDFFMLVGELDEDLHGRYGALQKHYDQFNKADMVDRTVVVYNEGSPAACGAYKQFEQNIAELKRVFVGKKFRNRGLAKLVVQKLEELAAEEGYRIMILETGIKQFEAIRLYEKLGYSVIENYGVYAGDTNSICMRKELLKP